MAETMIERVARAIFEAMDVTDGLDGSSATRYAVAAIKAMRDPTQAMVRDGDATPTSHSWGQSHLSAENAEFAMCEPIWQAMIDAALTQA